MRSINFCHICLRLEGMFFVLAAIIVAGLGGYLLYLDARRKRAQVADDFELYDDSAQDYGHDPIESAGDEAEAFTDHHDFDVGQGPGRETDYGQPTSPKPVDRPAQPGPLIEIGRASCRERV